jgi:nitroimidazol reductase NimA-like FMN-containing flavoprotein (pyridoxamine 5'-phosphate oxidase superfamily)
MGYFLRRKEKEVTDEDEMKKVLKTAQYVTIAMTRDERPYLISLNHGYDEGNCCIYFHCAKDGKKLDYIEANDSVWGLVLIEQDTSRGSAATSMLKSCSRAGSPSWSTGTKRLVTTLTSSASGWSRSWFWETR